MSSRFDRLRSSGRSRSLILAPLAIATTLVLACAALVGFGSGTENAQAASAEGFDAGYIISDANFYDSNALTASQVQDFLEEEVPTCHPEWDSNPSEITCLKDYTTTTSDKSSEAGLCTGYQGSQQQSAAQIIDGVARSCGISQKVLLVLLQKETGLVTHQWPSPWRYERAMGFNCPDTGAGNTANCEASDYGFFNQVYKAARAFKYYAAHPDNYAYKAGSTNSILWNPDTACGRSDVYIRNQATAALYIYTPYRPNDAALAAGFGTGDSCSSYGNRNFFLYYSEWFGSPNGYQVKGALRDAWLRDDSLGDPVEEERALSDGGYIQDFEGGTLVWKESTGAHAVKGSIRQTWTDLGGQSGSLGYPTENEVCNWDESNTNCYQLFENGAISWTPGTGAQATLGVLREAWARTGYEHGGLGYPTENQRSLAETGLVQDFQYGTLIWSQASGAHPVYGLIRETWGSLGWQSGRLGYPVSDEVCNWDPANTNCYQNFQGGAISWTPNTGAQATWGEIRNEWQRTGYENGRLGYPTGGEVCGIKDDGCYQNFQNGAITYTAATGAFPTTGEIRNEWQRTGYENGALGYPVADEVCDWDPASTNCVQEFQGGTISWTPATGATSTVRQ